MSFTVRLTRPAQRQLDDLDPTARRRIIRKLEELESNPRPPGMEKLAGVDDLYRVRVGDWRIIYTIENAELVVLVVKIGHRREVYRR